jgi:ABC-type multidrug transport system fused ATPase/permease subunit
LTLFEKFLDVGKLLVNPIQSLISRKPISSLKICTAFLLSIFSIYLKSNSHIYSGMLRNYIVSNDDNNISNFESLALTYAVYISIDKAMDTITQAAYSSYLTEISTEIYISAIQKLNTIEIKDRSTFIDDIAHSDIKKASSSIVEFSFRFLRIIRIVLEFIYFSFTILKNDVQASQLLTYICISATKTFLSLNQTKLLAKYKNDWEKKKSFLYNHAQEALARYELIQSNLTYELEKQILEDSASKIFISANKYFIYRVSTKILTEIISLVGIAGSLVFAYRISLNTGKGAIMQFQQSLVCLQALDKNVDDFLSEARILVESMEHILNIKKILIINNEKEQSSKFKTHPQSGSIEFRNVSLSIDDVPILNNISFKIPKGKFAVLLGETGSGKSSIAKLLLRFYCPTSGSVLIDDVDITRYSIVSLRKSITYLPQTPHIITDTISKNISYGHDKVSHTRIAQASTRACLNEYINRSPSQYDTVLEDSGKSLSGGLKKKISIARIFIKKSPIFLLDEPTSSLDHESKIQIIDNIKQYTTESTLLMITHDLEIAQEADLIFILKNGTITEQQVSKNIGTVNQILDSDGSMNTISIDSLNSTRNRKKDSNKTDTNKISSGNDKAYEEEHAIEKQSYTEVLINSVNNKMALGAMCGALGFFSTGSISGMAAGIIIGASIKPTISMTEYFSNSSQSHTH